MKQRVLALILTFSMVFTMLNGAFAAELPGAPRQSGDASRPTAYAAQASDFTDLPDDWSRGAIERAIENGLLSGANGKINASAQLTRAELAAIVVRAFGTTETASLSDFSDVNPSDWYYDALQKAVAMGILSGNNGKLNPNAPITREEVCAVLYRAFLLQDGGSAAQKFGDAGQISDWAQAAVAAMAAKGYIAGDSGGNVNGAKTITRAEFAQMMDNLVKGYPSGAQGGVIEGNAIMKAGQSLSGMTIKGDLILADGLGRNDVDLSDCTVEGRIIVRGGNEVKLSGTTRTGGGVVAAASAAVTNNTGSKLSSVSVEGANVNVTLSGEIGRVDVKADNVTVNAAGNAKIDAVETSASGTTVAGSGEVAEVNVNPGASNTSVTTNHTDITVAQGAGTVTSNNGSLSAGQTGTTDNKGALQANGTNASNTSKPSKDSSSDSGSKRPSRPSDVSDRVAVTDENGRTIGSFETGTVLTVDPNNGSRTYTVTVGSGTVITTPTCEGYTFNGWLVSGTTVTAQWTKNGDTPALIEVRDSEGRPIGAYMAGTQLTIDPANEKDEPYIFTVGTDNKTIPVPTCEGYHLNRWLPIGHTVTADWIKNTSVMTPVKRDDGVTIGNFEVGVTLTIDPNNGEEVYTVTVAPGLVIETPKKDGYNFVNWFRDPRTTITAQWSEVPVETGSVEGSEGRPIANYPIGTVLTVIPDNGVDEPYTVTVAKKTVIQRPTRDGYKFDRWEVIGTSIKALWTRKDTVKTVVNCSDGHFIGEYEVGETLTIDLANGKDEPYTVTVEEGLVIQHPTREGYTFKEWLRNPLTSLTATWTANQPVVTGSNMIYDGKNAAPIIVDSGYINSDADTQAERSYRQIVRAVGDLRHDIAMVNGAIGFEEVQQILDDDKTKQSDRLAKADQNKVPQLITGAENVQAKYAILVGSLNDSPMIQGLVNSGKFNEAKQIEGKWEAYAIKEIDNPISGVEKALVIAGSDARGTVYGIYSISEEIGVSPWYWWSDVPVDQKTKIDVDYTAALVDNGPDVKYRGIFINDEEQLREWAYHKYGWPNQVSAPGMYLRVYELLLRLKANTLWPAMHEGTESFNNVTGANGEEFINAKNAAEYGIFMSASHCEMMLRCNIGEWPSWYSANKSKYNIQGSSSGVAWDYTKNKTAVLAYWEERVASHKGFESIYPVGIRGVHDGGPRLDDLDGFINRQGQENGLGSEIEVNGTSKEAKQAALMKDVINEQRKIIKKYYGSENGAPQVFIPYKEMNTYYNMNNRDVADWLESDAPDVILMWSNDNHQYLRQTPNAQERKPGRYNGIYYHNSYWGTPKSWLWLNDASVSLMDSEMHRAYSTGADYYWVLNVGDIKPGDISAEYFMKMAWDVDGTDDTKIETELAAQVERDYNVDAATAARIADCLARYYQYSGTHRSEYYGKGFEFSVSGNGDEGMLWVNQWNALVDELERIYNGLNANAKDAFYEQILHAVKSARDVAEEYVYYAKNKQAVEQGRYGSSVAYRELGLAAIERIKENQDYYWSLNDGKWEYVINYSHRARYRQGSNGTSWSNDYQGNQGIILKNDSDYGLAEQGVGVGAACENNTVAGSGSLHFSSLEPNAKHYFDVFGKSASESAWVAESPNWIKLSKTSGSVYSEDRVTVSVDWTQVSGTMTGDIKIYNGSAISGNPVATFNVTATKQTSHLSEKSNAYQEANGYVMIEAEQYSRKTNGSDGTSWEVVTDLGQRADALRVMSAGGKADQNTLGIVENQTNGAQGACVEYDVYFEKAGTYKLIAYRLPSLDERTSTCRTYVAVNSETPSATLLKGNASTSGSWGNNILRMTEPLSVDITVNQGWNTIKLYRYSNYQMFDRLLITTDSKIAPPVSDIAVGAPVSPNSFSATLEEFQTNRVGVLPEEIGHIVQVISEEITLNPEDTHDIKIPADYSSFTISSAQSSNTASADVKQDGGKYVIEAKRAGDAVISLDLSNAAGETGKGVIHVTVENAGEGIYQILNGSMVIDTVDVLKGSEFAVSTAETGGSHEWKLDASGMKCLPDNGKDWGSSGSSAPVMKFTFTVAETGNYNLFINKTSKDDQDSTFFVQMDDGTLTNSGHDYGNLIWVQKGTFNLTAGTHTLSIYARQDGVVINQLYLTTQSTTPDTGVFLKPSPYVKAQPYISIDTIADQRFVTSDSAPELTVNAEVKNGAGGETVSLSASADPSDVVAVSVSDSKITLTPQNAGSATVTVTASAANCAAATTSFTVTIYNDGAKLAYIEKDGMIVIDAKDALGSDDYATKHDVDNHSWQTAKEGTAVQLMPNSGTNFTKTNDLTNTPYIEFKVYVAEAGTYFLNAYTAHPDNASDSFHVGVGGTYLFSSNSDDGGFGNNDQSAEKWYYGTVAKLSLSAGENNVRIWAREDGVCFKQFVFSKTQQSNLTDVTSTLGEYGANNPAIINAMELNAKEQEIQLVEMDNVELTIGGKKTVLPKLTEETDVQYTMKVSSDNDIVTIDLPENGKIILTGVGTGEAKITVQLVTDDEDEIKLAEQSFIVTVATPELPDKDDEKNEPKQTVSETIRTDPITSEEVVKDGEQ